MSEPGTETPRAMEERDSRRRQRIQRQLDEALAGTFPASDPVSMLTSTEEADEQSDAAAARPAGQAAREQSAPGPSPPGSRS